MSLLATFVVSLAREIASAWFRVVHSLLDRFSNHARATSRLNKHHRDEGCEAGVSREMAEKETVVEILLAWLSTTDEKVRLFYRILRNTSS